MLPNFKLYDLYVGHKMQIIDKKHPQSLLPLAFYTRPKDSINYMNSSLM